MRATRSPHFSVNSATTASALAFSRDPAITSCPTSAKRAARPRPAGPVAPKIPIRTAEVWHAGGALREPRHLGADQGLLNDAVGA